MAFEIIHRVLDELNLEEYKSSFSDECMNDQALGRIVKKEASYHRIIQRIIPRLGHAVEIRFRFMELFFPRNERERSGSARSRNESIEINTSSQSGSTDSLLVASRTSAQGNPPASAEKPARIWSPAPGPSTRLNRGTGHDQRVNLLANLPPPIPEVVGPTSNSEDEEAANDGALEFQSIQTPVLSMFSNKRKRTKLNTKLNHPASTTTKESREQVSQVNSNDASRGTGA